MGYGMGYALFLRGLGKRHPGGGGERDQPALRVGEVGTQVRNAAAPLEEAPGRREPARLRDAEVLHFHLQRGPRAAALSQQVAHGDIKREGNDAAVEAAL